MPTKDVPLEDEVGDVLEKAMRWAELSTEQIAEATDISPTRILDAIDYRSDLNSAELARLAQVLHLNEVGLCSLGNQKYPLPACPGLPFSVHPLRMPHGVVVANAYVISEPGSNHGILFDTGPSLAALLQNWPSSISHIDIVFLTHIEGEHTGGLCDVVDYFGISHAYVPGDIKAPCGEPILEGETKDWNRYQVIAYNTPGHASSHNCYRICDRNNGAKSSELLIAGDLIFAGSIGGSYFCGMLHQQHLKRLLGLCHESTVIAPGHGPLTTVGNELRFNPFLS